MNGGRTCPVRIAYDNASLEKSRKSLDDKDQPPSSFHVFMLDCDGHRHAEPVHNIYGFESRLRVGP